MGERFIYDPFDWEHTHPEENLDDMVADYDSNEVIEIAVLEKQPSRFFVKFWNENGDIERKEFSSADEAQKFVDALPEEES